MISLLLLFAFVVFFIIFPELRYTVFHLPTVLYNAVVDIYKYFRYKKYNSYREFGKMQIYVANEKQPFGSGKTLSIVDYVISVYKRYNGAIVWSDSLQVFVEQKIKIYSNVELRGIPYVPLVSYEQLINAREETCDTMIQLFVIDELGSQFNNRTWKNNLPMDLLEAILQQRKSKIAILGTVQDWSLFDKTLRTVSSECIVCSKRWRFVVNRVFYAKDMERAGYNVDLIQSHGVRCFFATDKVYNSYDTNERVDKLVQAVADGEILSNEEIINHANGDSADIDTLTTLKRKYRKRVRK